MEEQKEISSKEYLFADDDEIQIEPIGLSYDKNLLLDKTKQVLVKGLYTNQWGNYELICVIDEDETRLRINKSNRNTLIKMLGNRVGDWKGKTVNVSGILWEGNIDGNDSSGISLQFS